MEKIINNPKSLSEDIISISKDLKLHAFADYKEYIKNDLSTEEILHQLLKAELYIKKENKYKYRIKNAHFPVIKTLDTFEFDKKRLPNLNKDVVMELATCKFVEDKRNIVAIGNSGTGKTHLLTAICIEAITKGYTVRFVRASDLVTQMTEAASEKHLTQYIKKINTCNILFIDELGFLSFDTAGASLLFQIFAGRYETKSTLVSSNLEFSKWLTFLGKDEQMASALIGRLVDRSTVLNMNGENYRVQKR
jgi:DNA replication protein DnaC